MGKQISLGTKIYNVLKYWWSINWIKTVYFNFKLLPINQAKKLPVVFYGSVTFRGLKGKVIINQPIKFGMVGFGQRYELISVSKNAAQLTLNGTFIVNGHLQFGIDYIVYIESKGTLEMGHLSSLGANGKIICMDAIRFGDYARVGFESQVIDSSFHVLKDTVTLEKKSLTDPIFIGNYNFIGNRVSIMKSARTPDYCTVTSSSLVNKDFSDLGPNVLIGGIPAKHLRSNISRDWDSENFDQLLISK